MHTHSTYATAWAARGEPIPCVLTMVADEFGGEVPVGPFALIGDDSIGRGIVETLRRQPLPRGAHGGPRPVHDRPRRPRRRQGRRDARGRRPHRAHRPPARHARGAAAGRRRRSLFARYQNVYGQERIMTSVTASRRSGSSPAASTSTAGDPRPGRRAVRADPAARSPASGGLSAEIVGQPVLTEAAAIRRVMLEANADPDVPRRDHVDAHVLAGQDVDHRAGRAAQAAAAPAHPAQRGAALGVDRHGLHEPQPGRARRPRVRARRRPGWGCARKTVAGHASRPGAGARAIDGWIRAAAGRDHLDGLRLARFGDNMRDVAVTEGDKVEAELRFGVSVNTYGVNDLVARVDAVPDADVDALVAEYADSYRLAPGAGHGAATGTRRCATPPASRPGCASSCSTAGSAPSPPTSRTSAGCASSRAWPCSG